MKKIIVMLLTLIYQNLHGMHDELKNCPQTEMQQTKPRANAKQVRFSHVRVTTVPRYSHPRHYTRDNLSDNEESPLSADVEGLNSSQELCNNSTDFARKSIRKIKKQTPFFELMDKLQLAIRKECDRQEYHKIPMKQIGQTIQKILLDLHVEKYPFYKTLPPSVKQEVFSSACTIIKKCLMSHSNAKGS